MGTAKTSRVVDGRLKASAKDIRTVLRWTANVNRIRSLKTSSGRYNSDRRLMYELELEDEYGSCCIRGESIASTFKQAAGLIRSSFLSEHCRQNDIFVEGIDF